MATWTKNDTKGLISVLSGCAAGVVTAQAIYSSYGKKNIVGIVGSALVGALVGLKACDMVAYVTRWTLVKDETEEVEEPETEAEELVKPPLLFFFLCKVSKKPNWYKAGMQKFIFLMEVCV